jgi:hypothetical protein
MIFRSIMTACLAIAIPATLAAGETLVDVDFSKTAKEVHKKDKGVFDGPLPKGVSEDFPAWNTSEATSEKLSENGRDFVRFNVKKLDQLVLFRLSNAMEMEPGYYEIKVLSRCPDKPLNLHVRIVPKPYTTFCEADTKTGSDWTEQSFILEMKKEKRPFSEVVPDFSKLGLFISLKEGVTDIASVTLRKSDRNAFVALHAKEIERPAKGLANLFRNSRLPLGPQAGWSVSRDNVGGTLEADTANPGPSGAPSLKIAAETPIAVYSEPFQTDDPNAKCQVSFAYKATGSWSAKAGGVKKDLPASDKWQTATISFTPDPLARAFSLNFAGKGTLNIDSLMAHAGDKPLPYASAGDCEIALAPADSMIEDTRILFSDEPAKLKFCATGDIEGATLKAKAVNIYGEERPLPGIKLGRSLFGKLSGASKSFMESGEMDFGVFPDAPLGAFRVEVWAERDGKRISPVNEIVMNVIRRPLHWGKDAPNSPFGGHFYSNPRVVTTMKAAGMNWVRCNDVSQDATCWGYLEAEKGKWQFQDEKVARYRDGKLKILGYIGSAPTWASYYPGYKSPHYFDLMYQPKDIEAFKNYVRTMAAHYKGSIDEYQFQNEPWGYVFWHKSYDPKTGQFDQGETPAQDYAELSKVAYVELKKACPEAVMYGFNSRGDAKGEKWTQEVFDAGAYPYCDMIDYHHYNGARALYCIPGDGAETAYGNAIGYIKAKAPAPIKPIVNSEGNPGRGGAIPTSLTGKDDFTGLYKNTIPWTSKDDTLKLTDMTVRFIASHLALKVKRLFLYSDHCYHNMLHAPSFPVLLGADGYPSPTLAAFSNMAWLLEDRPFVKRVQVADKVWAYLFAGRGATVALISGTEDGKFSVPAKLETLDLFGNRIKGSADYKGRIMYAISDLPVDKVERILTAK